MNITIEYCVSWNYFPQASSLAAAIKKEFNVTAEYIKSGGGVFEVVKDGNLIFSKRSSGRFPNNEEVINGIKSTGWEPVFCRIYLNWLDHCLVLSVIRGFYVFPASKFKRCFCNFEPAWKCFFQNYDKFEYFEGIELLPFRGVIQLSWFLFLRHKICTMSVLDRHFIFSVCFLNEYFVICEHQYRIYLLVFTIFC